MVKNLPATREMWVWILGWEDSPGEGNGNPLQFLAWRILIDRGAWQAIVHRVAKSRTWLSDFTFILSLSLGLPLMAVWKIRLSWWLRWCLCPDLIAGARKSPGKRNGYPLQYSRLENSMNRGAWWDTVHGVEKQSDTTEWLTLSHVVKDTLKILNTLKKLLNVWISLQKTKKVPHVWKLGDTTHESQKKSKF